MARHDIKNNEHMYLFLPLHLHLSVCCTLKADWEKLEAKVFLKFKRKEQNQLTIYNTLSRELISNKLNRCFPGIFEMNVPACFGSHDWFMTSRWLPFFWGSLSVCLSVCLFTYQGKKRNIYISVSTTTASLSTTTATTTRTKHNRNRSHLCVWWGVLVGGK